MQTQQPRLNNVSQFDYVYSFENMSIIESTYGLITKILFFLPHILWIQPKPNSSIHLHRRETQKRDAITNEMWWEV